jgi:hypothetical protein
MTIGPEPMTITLCTFGFFGIDFYTSLLDPRMQFCRT